MNSLLGSTSSFPPRNRTIKCRQMGKMFQEGIMYGNNPLKNSYPRLLLQISTITIFTRLIHFLLRPLKQPRVVAEIIAGIIVGPSVLGRSKLFAKTMFPDNGSLEYQTIAIIGMVYFLFVVGVKMDISMVSNAGKRVIYTGIYGVVLPLGTVVAVSLLLRDHLDKGMAGLHSIVGLACSLSMTGFIVIYIILKELDLLNSDLGRLAMSTAMISDAAAWNAIIIFEALMQASVDQSVAIRYLLSVFGLVGVTIFGFRPASRWIVRRTPPGKPVNQLYVVLILLGVLIIGFVSDFVGATVVEGPLMLGLAIPDGPPLGTTLVDRTEAIVELFMPLIYAYMGQSVDIFSIKGWSSWGPLLVIATSGYITKLLGTLLPSLYFKMPFRDALTLSLILSLRGQVELFTYMHWLDYGMLTQETFTILILSLTMVTAVATPTISILERPTVPYTMNKRRTIEHLPPNTELHIVTCIYEQENVPALVKLLEASHASKYNPIVVYALHLVELTGRATPIFISHHKHRITNKHARSSNPIVTAFKNYEKNTGEHVLVQAFTAVSPYNTMYRDIVRLALEKKASLIIMPFHMRYLEAYDHAGTAYQTERMVNSAVQAHAPCSVGIFVDRGRHKNFVARSLYVPTFHVVVLFLGGADSREALAYADRMSEKISVSLLVVRFLSSNRDAEDARERQLDDQVVELFLMKNTRNEVVGYKEVVVKDGLETVNAIRAMNDGTYDLWIVGRQKVVVNEMLVKGLAEWSENPELGVIGDFISSPDFEGSASVLVVQQQVLQDDQSGVDDADDDGQHGGS